MTHPDNFSAAAFRRAHGDAEYDAAEAKALTAVSVDAYAAALLRRQLTSWIAELDGMEFRTIFPAPGYEMEDLLGMMRDIRDKIDLDAYAKRAREIALDKELNR